MDLVLVARDAILDMLTWIWKLTTFYVSLRTIQCAVEGGPMVGEILDMVKIFAIATFIFRSMSCRLFVSFVIRDAKTTIHQCWLHMTG